MTIEQNIEQLISCGENSQVQFKQQWTTTKQIAAELIAFANSKGGTIIFGVQDKTGEIIGLTYDECQTITQELGNTANELIRPTLYVRTNTVKVGDKILLLANVDEGLNKPYKDLQGAIWIKQGADKRHVTENSEILYLFQDSGNYFPDEHSVRGTSIKDLNGRLIDAYLDKKSGDIDLTIPQEQILRNLRIVSEDGKLTMGGLLFFGKHPQQYLLPMQIKAVSFFGNSMGGLNYRDSKDIEGTIPEMFEQGMSFLKSNLHAVQAGQNFNSLGVLEISQIALEELLQNALVHRNYLAPAPIRILIFDDRVEIINPCHLGKGMTVEKILQGVTYQSNPLLAKFCADTMIYRGLGTGIKRAKEAFPELQITCQEGDGEFKVTLCRLDKVTQNVRKDVEKDVEKEPTERQQIILQLMRENDQITIIEMSEKMSGKKKVQTRTLDRDIKSLTEMGYIARIGGRKQGHWVVLKK